MTRILRTLSPLLIVFLFFSALWIIHLSLEEYHYREIVSIMKTLPAARLSNAALLTLASYLIMTGYDLLALSYIRVRLPVLKTSIQPALSALDWIICGTEKAVGLAGCAVLVVKHG